MDLTIAHFIGISSSLDEEISPLGLRSICVEPGWFRTDVLKNAQSIKFPPRIEDYAPMTTTANATFTEELVTKPQQLTGDPVKFSKAVCDVVSGQGLAIGKTLPQSILLGKDCYATIKKKLEEKLRNMEEWRELSESTEYDQEI
jgi:NAD(P)-dependent dehydrogenase (short-subunit alcohol dehydrogenase family)